MTLQEGVLHGVQNNNAKNNKQINRLIFKEGIQYESQTFCKENLREVQDY